MNIVSLHRSACDKVFDPGLRFRPLEFVIQRGTPLESEIRETIYENLICKLDERKLNLTLDRRQIVHTKKETTTRCLTY